MQEDIFGGGVLQVIKGVAVSLLTSVFLTAVFALILRVRPMSSGWITIVTQILKGVSLILGVLLFVKGSKGFLKGGICGLIFCMLGYLTFASLGGGFALSWLILVEVLLFCSLGALAGIVAVHLKRG